MLRGDKDWIPFIKDIDKAIKKSNPGQRKSLKSIRKFARKNNYITINQFKIVTEIFDDILDD